MEKGQKMTRTGRILRRVRLAAGATGAAVLAGFASMAVVYGDDGDVVLVPWWL